MSIFNIPLEKNINQSVVIKEEVPEEHHSIPERKRTKEKSIIINASLDVECVASENDEIEVYIENDINNKLLNKHFVITNKKGVLKIKQEKELRGHTLIVSYVGDYENIEISGSCSVDFKYAAPKSLILSGSVKLVVGEVYSGLLDIVTSGSANLEFKSLNEIIEDVGNLNITSSGSSKIKINKVSFHSVEISSSGSSNVKLVTEKDISECSIVSSGASRIDMTKTYGNYIELNCSGTSNVTFGTYNTVEAYGSGCANITGGYGDTINKSSKGVSSVNISSKPPRRPLLLR